MDACRKAALIEWRKTWPDSLHVERQYDPTYIAQREAFVAGYLAASKLRAATEPKEQA